jgi:hypothetical protein
MEITAVNDDYYPDVDALFEERYCVEEPWIDRWDEDDDDYSDDDDDSPMVGATDEVRP